MIITLVQHTLSPGVPCSMASWPWFRVSEKVKKPHGLYNCKTQTEATDHSKVAFCVDCTENSLCSGDDDCLSKFLVTHFVCVESIALLLLHQNKKCSEMAMRLTHSSPRPQIMQMAKPVTVVDCCSFDYNIIGSSFRCDSLFFSHSSRS